MFLKYKNKKYGIAEKTGFREFEEFDFISKKNNSISCFKNNKLILKLSGIKDMQNYTIENGEFTIEGNKEEEIEKLKIAMAELSVQIAMQNINNK